MPVGALDPSKAQNRTQPARTRIFHHVLPSLPFFKVVKKKKILWRAAYFNAVYIRQNALRVQQGREKGKARED